ncbi:MAG: hypothetical protein WCE62_15705 [Polyangiales bacterium]
MGTLLTTLAVAGLALEGCRGGESHAAAETAPLPVVTAELRRLESDEVRRVFTRTVRSRRASRLGFQRGGMVSKGMTGTKVLCARRRQAP